MSGALTTIILSTPPDYRTQKCMQRFHSQLHPCIPIAGPIANATANSDQIEGIVLLEQMVYGNCLRVVGRSRGLPDTSLTTLDGFGKHNKRKHTSRKQSEHVVSMSEKQEHLNLSPYNKR